MRETASDCFKNILIIRQIFDYISKLYYNISSFLLFKNIIIIYFISTFNIGFQRM